MKQYTLTGIRNGKVNLVKYIGGIIVCSTVVKISDIVKYINSVDFDGYVYTIPITIIADSVA